MISQEFIIQNFPQGEVTIVSGRPAMGKSSFATSLALSLAKYGKKSIFFTFELSKEKLIKRMKIQVGDEYYASNSAMIIINDAPSSKLHEIKEQLDKESADYIFIDYLQLIDSEFEGPRSEELDHIMSRLKQWAVEFKVTIIILSQLMREWPRGLPRPYTWVNRPTLSNLETFFSKTLDGTNIIFIHRPEYYILIDVFAPKENIIEKIEILKYKDDECIISYLNLNTETTKITT